MECLTRATLRLASKSGREFTPVQVSSFGPMLQGVLMETIDSAYAERLHVSAFNPYSQYATLGENGEVVWVISTLNNEATERIIEPLSKLRAIDLRGVDESFVVGKATEERLPVDCLLEKIKEGQSARHRIRFVSPTSFKVRGEYVIMPNTRLVLQNLLMHYNQVYSGDNEIDADTLSYMEKHVRISAYNLRSRYFSYVSNGKGKLPAFVGDVTFSVAGPQPLQGLVSMLLEFGEYAGIGIKTSMGMGGMRQS